MKHEDDKEWQAARERLCAKGKGSSGENFRSNIEAIYTMYLIELRYGDSA